MLPALSNAGRRPPSDSTVVPGRTPSSVSTTTGSPLRWGTSTGTISSAKRPSLIGARRPARATWPRSVVLRLAVEAGGGRVLLGAGAHGHLVEGAEQAVVHHRVDDRLVAEAVALAGPGEQVRGLGHRLHAAGDDDVGRARLDHAGRPGRWC